MRTALCALLLAAACHHESSGPKMEPGEVAPLPPASGTVVGVLVDSAGELHLRDDQLAKLRDIDQGLTARNERGGATPHASGDSSPPPSARRGGRHGGMGGMGGMGGPGGGGMGHSGHHGGHHRGSAAGDGSAAPSATHAADEKHANEVDALRRAFAVLDDDQRTAARKLLDDRGIDISGIDAGMPPTPPTSSPDEPVPQEP